MNLNFHFYTIKLSENWTKIGVLCLSFIAISSYATEWLPKRALSLEYGDALYSYHQQEWYSSLLKLEVIEYKEIKIPHGIHPQLLKAGIYLDYQMPETARTVLLALLNPDATNGLNVSEKPSLSTSVKQSISKKDEAFARFMLAKTYIELKQYKNAYGEVISMTGRGLNHQLADQLKLEFLYIQGQLALFLKEELDKALAVIKRMPPDNLWSHYLIYNTAVLAVISGDKNTAITLVNRVISESEFVDARNQFIQESRKLSDEKKQLEKENTPVGTLPPANIEETVNYSNEARVLLDKFYSLSVVLALDSIKQLEGTEKRQGISELLSNLGEIDVFSANARALLTMYAYELAKQNNGLQASKILTYLQQPQPNKNGVSAQEDGLEDSLDVSYLLAYLSEKNKDVSVAISSYRKVIADVEQNLKNIDQEMALLESRDLGKVTNPTYYSLSSALFGFLNTKEMDDLIRQRRELKQLLEKTDLFKEKAALFDLVISQRNDLWEKKSPQIEDVISSKHETEIETQLSTLLSALKLSVNPQNFRVEGIGAADEEETFFTVSGGQTVALNERVKRVQLLIAEFETEIKANPTGPIANKYRQRLVAWKEQLRRYKGLLYWNASEDYPGNLWAHKKVAQEIVASLGQYKTARNQLKTKLLSNIDNTLLTERINNVNPKISLLTRQLEARYNDVERKIRARFKRHFANQKSKAKEYLLLSRIALARLSDDILKSKIKGDQ